MAKGLLRVGVVGASSLIGNELVEELGASALGIVDVMLLDEEVESGQVTAVGDEASFVQRLGAGSFDGMDLCFFAGSAETTRKHWRAAVQAGAGVVDVTNALEREDGVLVRAPWVSEPSGRGELLGLGTVAVAPVHPVAAMLSLVAVRCLRLGLTGVAATVLEPASERGTAGLDEMHRQTVSLLSFQSVPREEFDAQVAFNLLPELGAGARVPMVGVAQRIVRDYAAAVGGALPELSLQMVHAPAFHGYAVSALLDFRDTVTAQAVEAALAGEHVEVVAVGDEAPSNLTAAGQGRVLARVSEGSGARCWVWMAADNLKLGALHAIACAGEWQAMRPQGKVQ